MNKNIIDTNFLGLFISDLINYRAKKLLPKIKQLFDLEIVSYWICGNYESVREDCLKEFNKTQEVLIVKKNQSLSEIYNAFSKVWYHEETEKEEKIVYDNNISKFIPQLKVGRNEPCPCGSGKKHKKCCLNS